MVFYLGITVFQYSSQNGVVPMGPKQPGPAVHQRLYSLCSFTLLFQETRGEGKGLRLMHVICKKLGASTGKV